MKKAMVVLAVLAMAVSGCDTGLQDKIDQLEKDKKELEQQLEEARSDLSAKETEKGTLDKKIEALDQALAADTDAKITAAKTALKSAGYSDAEINRLMANIPALIVN